MSTTLNYKLKDAMPELAKEHRWHVLTVYILHANRRNRAWCSTETIANMVTGSNKKRAIRARNWLVNHGALERVPNEKRFGGVEESLPNRLHVYELTGEVTIDGVTYPYLYVGENHSSQMATVHGSHLATIHGSQMATQSISNISSSSSSPDEEVTEPPRPQVFGLWESEVGALTPMLANHLKDAVAEFPDGWVHDAISEARVSSNRVTWKYVKAILDRWQSDGRDSSTQGKAVKSARNEKDIREIMGGGN